MKSQVLHMLMMAKSLMSRAEDSCFLEDRYEASAGLIMLQDSVELILLACLIELGVDEEKNIHSLSFEQLIGELKKQGFPVPKSGTVKALNRQRVIVKHYGEVSEPRTVANLYHTSNEAMNLVLQRIVDKTLPEIVLSDGLRDGEAKVFLKEAAEEIIQGNYFDALVWVRKAVFVEIEDKYNIYKCRNRKNGETEGLFSSLGGHSAPYYTRYEDWILKNVNTPFDYIQYDYDKIRNEIVEWGGNTQNFWNITRLTPQLFRAEKGASWLIKEDFFADHSKFAEQNASYCLDRAVVLIAQKQRHIELHRSNSSDHQNMVIVTIRQPTTVYKKACLGSERLGEAPAGIKFWATQVVPALDDFDQKMVLFVQLKKTALPFVGGYVKREDCDLQTISVDEWKRDVL